MNGVPSASSCRTTGSATSGVNLLDEGLLAAELLGEPGQRRIGAHATRVGSGVAVERTLEVLRGAERTHGVAIAQEEEGDLGAGEELLDQHRAGGKILFGVREGLGVGRT